jgi:F-type H+-transporting ATPase subunit beta
MSEQHVGKVVEVIGPVVVVAFEGGHLPAIYNAVRITSQGFEVPAPIDVIAEVEQHLGEGRAKCVAMQPTDGMVRGMIVEDQGGPITVPVGKGTLGRVMNVIGQPVDKLGPGSVPGTLAHPSPCAISGGSEHQPGGF